MKVLDLFVFIVMVAAGLTVSSLASCGLPPCPAFSPGAYVVDTENERSQSVTLETPNPFETDWKLVVSQDLNEAVETFTHDEQQFRVTYELRTDGRTKGGFLP